MSIHSNPMALMLLAKIWQEEYLARASEQRLAEHVASDGKRRSGWSDAKMRAIALLRRTPTGRRQSESTESIALVRPVAEEARGGS